MDYPILVAAISLFQPPIIEIFKHLWINKLDGEQIQKSVSVLLSISIGIGISLLVDWLGDYHLGKMNIFLYGAGISFTSGQIAHRVINYVKPLQEILTVKGRNGSQQIN